MDSFERFLTKYQETDRISDGGSWLGPDAATGWDDLLDRFAGATFNRGLYRLHTARSGAATLPAVLEMRPDFVGRLVPFGFDWLGREFAIDLSRPDSRVLLLEPGTGEVLEIPASFASFHNDILVDVADAAVAESFWSEWSAGSGASLPLAHGSCVGYKVPLFLGGADTVENLEVADRAVYWSLSAQLVAQTRGVPPGTHVDGVRVE